MNLELPFPAADASEVEDALAAIADELDAIFLDEMDGALRRIRAEEGVKPDVAAA